MGCKSPLINIISLIYINQLELLKWSVSGIHYKLVHIDRPIFGVDNKVLRVKGFSLLGVFHDEIISVEGFSLLGILHYEVVRVEGFSFLGVFHDKINGKGFLKLVFEVLILELRYCKHLNWTKNFENKKVLQLK